MCGRGRLEHEGPTQLQRLHGLGGAAVLGAPQGQPQDGVQMLGHEPQLGQLRILPRVGPDLVSLANGDGGPGPEPRDVSLAVVPLLLAGHASPW
ncbi:hypothetical protein [Streptomyces sp. NPDC001410]|uniref:hypothetical protein n=1 Tax=Streptomyces sp. NPDC001410 TaxID=3364574 RepID=UPI0036A268E3